MKAKNWYVLQVNGSRVVIDKSEDGKNAICSPVNAADLKLVNAKPTKTVDELIDGCANNCYKPKAREEE